METLMHTCCAPCSVSCIRQLREEGIEPVSFWYNPNIHPYQEYKARRDTLMAYAPAIGMKLIVREDYGLRDFCRAVSQFRITETRITVIRETDIRVELNHIFHSIHVFDRKFLTETIDVCHTQGLAEDIDCRQMIVRVQFILTAVRVNLFFYFTVQNAYPTLSPSGCLFKFREKCTCIDHTLCFEQQMVALIRVIAQNV